MTNNTEEIHFEKEETITITESFKEEMRFLEKEGAIALAQVRIQEEYMNEKEKVDQYNVNQLYEIVEKFIRILSLMDAYKYFQDKKTLLTDENIGNFLFLVKNDYSIRVNKFIKDLNKLKSKSKLKSKLKSKNRNRNRNRNED